MPETTVRAPDGTPIVVSHPPGASDDQILAFASKSFDSGKSGTTEQPLNINQGKGVPNYVADIGDGLFSFLSGFPATIAGGIAGAGTQIGTLDNDAAVDVTNNVSGAVYNALGGEPETEIGKKTADILNYPFHMFERGIDRVGEFASEKSGSPLAGTATKTGLAALPFGIGRKRPRSNRQNVAAAAQERGFIVDPASTGRSSALEGVGGKLKTQQIASQKNTANTQRLVRDEFGFPADTPITPELLSKYRAEQAAAYQALELQGNIPLRTSFRRDISNAQSKLKKLEGEFAGITGASELFQRVGELMNKPALNADVVVPMIRIVREKADAAYTAGSKQQGAAWRGVADALEGAVEAELSHRGNAQLLDSFRQSRQNIAKSYTVESALDGGQVSGIKLAQSKAPLSGSLKQIAEFAESFPKINRVLNEGIPNFSPLDVGVAAPSLAAAAGLGSMGFTTAGGAALLPAITQLARPAMRSAALGPLGQRGAIRPPLDAASFSPGLVEAGGVGRDGLLGP